MFTYKELRILKQSIEISLTALAKENKTYFNKMKKDSRDQPYYSQLMKDNDSKIVELCELDKKIDDILK